MSTVYFRTQDLPMLIRMGDRDSSWGIINGLHSIITALLQLNSNGYVLYDYILFRFYGYVISNCFSVLPDMIGGNGYLLPPTAELIARWTQANTFMPSMQFSYLPWEVTSDDVCLYLNVITFSKPIKLILV
jgi:hypothetical protein